MKQLKIILSGVGVFCLFVLFASAFTQATISHQTKPAHVFKNKLGPEQKVEPPTIQKVDTVRVQVVDSAAVAAILDGISARTKQNPETFYKILVKHAVLDGLAWVCMLAFGYGAGLALIFNGFRLIAAKKEDELIGWNMFPGFIICILLLVISIFTLPSLLDEIFNPGYTALFDIAKLFHL
jgi:hypothetical protein